MDYTAYQEGSFATTVKSLQAQVQELNRANLLLQKQIHELSLALQQEKSSNINLKALIGRTTESSVAPAPTKDNETVLVNEVGETPKPKSKKLLID